MTEGTVDKAWFKERWEAVGIPSQAEFARRAGFYASAMNLLLKGARRTQLSEARRIAELLELDVGVVAGRLGVDLATPQRNVHRVLGYVGASGEVHIFNTEDADAGLDEVELPFLAYNGTCLSIRGDSMSPRYFDREIIGVHLTDVAAWTPEPLIGLDVVAQCVDGRLLLKNLQWGTEPGLFTLISINPRVAPIQNIALDWASRVDFHLPSLPTRSAFR